MKVTKLYKRKKGDYFSNWQEIQEFYSDYEIKEFARECLFDEKMCYYNLEGELEDHIYDIIETYFLIQNYDTKFEYDVEI